MKCIRCSRDTIGKLKTCRRCLNLYRVRREKKKNDGDCAACHRSRTDKRYAECQKCRDRRNARKAEARKKGYCTWCGMDPSDGYTMCKKCRKRLRDRNLEKRYSITASVYDDLLEAQGGKCAACKRPPGRRRLSVDHNHATGEVRGLLCDSCNRALGFLKDSPEIIRRLAEYSTRHQQLRLIKQETV